MKKLLLLVGLALAVPVFQTACTTAPSARVVQVQTLKAVGESAEASVTLSAQLYRDGHITAAQARQVLDFYNLKFQPSFRVAVAAVNSDLSSIASPDVISLAQQLAALVTSFQKPSV